MANLNPNPVPSPTDWTVPEYDAPVPMDTASLAMPRTGQHPQRPASRVVVNPSVRPTTIVRG